MGALASHGHGEFGLMQIKQARRMTDHGPGGKDIVKGGETMGAALLMKNREVFGMSVGCREKPKHQLGLEEGPLVLVRPGTGVQYAQNILHPGTSLILVFIHSGYAQGLTEILLGK